MTCMSIYNPLSNTQGEEEREGGNGKWRGKRKKNQGGGERRKESKNWKDNKREKKGVIHQSNATKT